MDFKDYSSIKVRMLGMQYTFFRMKEIYIKSIKMTSQKYSVLETNTQCFHNAFSTIILHGLEELIFYQISLMKKNEYAVCI